MEALSHPNATGTQLDEFVSNGGESVTQRHFRRPKVLAMVLFGLLVIVGLVILVAHRSHGAPQCVKGKLGPLCSSDSDCNGVLGCARCAKSKHCTAEPSHYADPEDVCQAGEQEVWVQGIKGAFCSPACSGTGCPTDVPIGVTAQPECVLQLEDRGSSKLYCALICTPGSNECGAATCKSIHGAGICTYDDDAPSPGPSPPSPVDDCFESDDKGACEAKPADGCHWCQILGLGICLPTECPATKSTRLVTTAFSPHAKIFDATAV